MGRTKKIKYRKTFIDRVMKNIATKYNKELLTKEMFDFSFRLYDKPREYQKKFNRRFWEIKYLDDDTRREIQESKKIRPSE